MTQARYKSGLDVAWRRANALAKGLERTRGRVSIGNQTRARMPLDAKPVAAADYSGNPGHLFAIADRGDGELIALGLRKISDGVDLWHSGDLAARLSHFGTCPNAEVHRKPKEPGTELVPVH